MNTDAICPDCGAQFDTSEPMLLAQGEEVAILVYKCDNCGHFVYELADDHEENDPESL